MKKYDERDIQELISVINSGELGTAKASGVKTQEFEKKFSSKINAKYAVAVSSATGGLHMALLSAGIGNGDEVLVDPLFKFGAITAIHSYATPVFYDIELDNYMPSVELIKKKVTKRTKALIVTNIFGCTCNLAALSQFCKENNIVFIEDCAQSIIATFGKSYAGTIGDIGVFSFQNTKHLAIGDGGMVVTDNKILYNNLLALREHGYTREKYDDTYKSTKNLGWMYRITELQSAVGVAQLSKLDSIVDYYSRIGKMLSEIIGSEVIIPQKSKYGKHVYWKWAAFCKEQNLINFLEDNMSNCQLIEFGHNKRRVVYQSVAFQKNEYCKTDKPCVNAEKLTKSMIIIKISYKYEYSQYKQLANDINEKISKYYQIYK